MLRGDLKRLSGLPEERKTPFIRRKRRGASVPNMRRFASKPVALIAGLALSMPVAFATGPFTGLALAQDAFDLSVPKADEGAAEPSSLECASEALSGSGPGFASARDDSEAAAIEAWLEKATAVYPDATWASAKDSNLACVVQGLYSKCFADGIPCKPKVQ